MILVAKYYVYIQDLLNTNIIDFHSYLVTLENKLQTEKRTIYKYKARPSK